MWTILPMILFHKGEPQAGKAAKDKSVHLTWVKSTEIIVTF